MPAVTIIVGVYNGEKFLGELLDSIRAQTSPDWCCLCVNDGSTDGSAEILTRAAAADSRISVITQENGGVGAARNAALNRIETPYVMFADQDDTFAPNAVERAVLAIESESADVLHFYSSRNVSHSIFVWEHIFRTAVFSDVRFPSITGGEDTALFWELGFKNLKRASIDDRLYLNRAHDGSFSRAVSPGYIDNVFKGFRVMWDCGLRYGQPKAGLLFRLFPHVFWFSVSVLVKHFSWRNLKTLLRDIRGLFAG